MTTGCNHLGIAVSDAAQAHRWFVSQLGLPEAWPPGGSDQVVSAGITAGNNFIELEQWTNESSDSSIIRIGVALTCVSAKRSSKLLEARGISTPRITETVPPNYPKIINRYVELPELSSDRMLVYLVETEVLDDTHDVTWCQSLLDQMEGGRLGIKRLHEIVIEVDGTADRRKLWAKLLDPSPQITPGLWKFPNGPSLRLSTGEGNEVKRLLFEVQDLAVVTDHLSRSGLELTDHADLPGARHPEGLEVCFLQEPRPS